jgi:hypothetical protein
LGILKEIGSSETNESESLEICFKQHDISRNGVEDNENQEHMKQIEGNFDVNRKFSQMHHNS